MVVHTRFATSRNSDNCRNCRIADMASRDPPKKEDPGKTVPKQEALDARVTELCTSLQEIMAHRETLGQESSANETPLTKRRTDPDRSAPTNGLCHWESYCLLVRVVKDALGLSERDVRLPAHAFVSPWSDVRLAPTKYSYWATLSSCWGKDPPPARRWTGKMPML